MDKQDDKFEELLQKFAEDVKKIYGELDRQEIENAVRDTITDLMDQAESGDGAG